MFVARKSAIADKPRDAFAQMQWRGWPKTHLSCRIWSFCVKVYRHKYRRTPPKWGALGFCCLEMGSAANPNIHAFSPMCYHFKLGSCVSKGVCIHGSEPQNRGALEPYILAVGRRWPLEIHPSRVCYAAEFGLSKSNGTNVIKEINLKKNWSSYSAFQRRSIMISYLNVP